MDLFAVVTLAERTESLSFIDCVVFAGELTVAGPLPDVVGVAGRLLVVDGCTEALFSIVPTVVVRTLLTPWELDNKELEFSVELNVVLRVEFELEDVEPEFTELGFSVKLECTELESVGLEFPELGYSEELGFFVKLEFINDVDEELVWFGDCACD